MIVGLCTLVLRLDWSNSLKEKRREVKSLIERARAKFNISIAETECQDQWKTAVIGFAVVSSERRHVDSSLNRVIDFIAGNTEAELVSKEIEII